MAKVVPKKNCDRTGGNYRNLRMVVFLRIFGSIVVFLISPVNSLYKRVAMSEQFDFGSMRAGINQAVKGGWLYLKPNPTYNTFSIGDFDLNITSSNEQGFIKYEAKFGGLENLQQLPGVWTFFYSAYTYIAVSNSGVATAYYFIVKDIPPANMVQDGYDQELFVSSYYSQKTIFKNTLISFSNNVNIKFTKLFYATHDYCR